MLYLTGILIVKQHNLDHMIITNNNSVSQVSAGELELINMTVALSSEEITQVHMCDNTGRVFTFPRRRLCVFDGLS